MYGVLQLDIDCRLYQSLIFQLHTLVSDEACYKVMEHYAWFVEQLTSSHLRAESRVGMEASYQKAVESLLGDDNCFKVMFVSVHVCLYQQVYLY